MPCTLEIWQAEGEALRGIWEKISKVLLLVTLRNGSQKTSLEADVLDYWVVKVSYLDLQEGSIRDSYLAIGNSPPKLRPVADCCVEMQLQQQINSLVMPS